MKLTLQKEADELPIPVGCELSIRPSHQRLCAQEYPTRVAQAEPHASLAGRWTRRKTSIMMRLAPLTAMLLGLNQPLYAQAIVGQFQNWVVSETTSPVDYSPLIMATNFSRPSTMDAPSSLIIRCHGKQPELALTTNGSWGPQNFNRVTYQIDERSPVQQRWTPSPDGRSISLSTDVIGFVRALPDTGYILFRVYGSEAVPYETTFQLSGLGAVRRRLAVCSEN